MPDELTTKVRSLLHPALGDATEKLSGTKLHRDVIARIRAAFSDELGAEAASRLGMHMSDWIGDAAFLFALHLHPDEFDDAEVRTGVERFLGHAPSHIRAACGITGNYVWEDFPDDDPSTWEQDAEPS